MQGLYWLLTIPQNHYTPYLPSELTYVKGQLERGSGTGYLHWQLLVAFKSKCRLSAVKKLFGEQCHAELARSEAAREYVWKDDTSVAGTRFELGQFKLRRNNKRDWEQVYKAAKEGRLDDIQPDILVPHYNNLKRIASDNLAPVGIEKQVFCFWGRTGLGKSRRAWDEAGLDAYPKDPRTKFWDGYRGQENVVVDEFRGGIDVAHLLRWLDRYPVTVEIKGSATVLRARRIWITSNLDPRLWYPDLDQDTIHALLRRLEIVHFEINPFVN